MDKSNIGQFEVELADAKLQRERLRIAKQYGVEEKDLEKLNKVKDIWYLGNQTIKDWQKAQFDLDRKFIESRD